MDSDSRSVSVGARVVLSDGQSGTILAIGPAVQVELDGGRIVDVGAGALTLEPVKPVIGPGSGYPEGATTEQILGAPKPQPAAGGEAIEQPKGEVAAPVTGDGTGSPTP